MARKLALQDLKNYATVTHEGASAYDYSETHPLIHLTFTMGSALLVDGFYQTQQEELRSLVKALMGAFRAEPRFAWQYGAWMRDPRDGKGNRIQGSLVPALLDALTDSDAFTAEYVAKCLRHRPDDVVAFVQHYAQLGLGAPSAAARKGMAEALTAFDEYQLMKYGSARGDVRLCDTIYMVKDELEALGQRGALALAAGRYFHAPTRKRDEHLDGLPLTAARRRLWRQPKDYALDTAFVGHVAEARVTWEQVVGHFGTDLATLTEATDDDKAAAVRRNHAVWAALLAVPGLMPDMALLRNLRNLHEAGYSVQDLKQLVDGRPFHGVWPHQVYAGFKAVPQLEPVFSKILAQTAVAFLPPGRHLGVADISGSMCTRVGGVKGSIQAMDVSLCFVGLMSESSGLGASFDNGIHVAQRSKGEGALAFTRRREINTGWGGTQIFGSVMELIAWLKRHDDVQPPDCLWFFSDMQFHPAAAATLPGPIAEQARKLGIDLAAPPLEIALKIYRAVFGPVDVVLWNLAAYEPTPVPSNFEGVLLVSGFDANTFRAVQAWREGGQGATAGGGTVEANQEVVLDAIRRY